jgi:hypothetical protein
VFRLDEEVEGPLGAKWYLPHDLSLKGSIRLLPPPETSEVRAARKPLSDFCLYNIDLYELGIDPANVLPPTKAGLIAKAQPQG